jgi:hypothetical protein
MPTPTVVPLPTAGAFRLLGQPATPPFSSLLAFLAHQVGDPDLGLHQVALPRSMFADMREASKVWLRSIGRDAADVDQLPTPRVVRAPPKAQGYAAVYPAASAVLP